MSDIKGVTLRTVGNVPAYTPFTLAKRADGTMRVLYDAATAERANAPVIKIADTLHTEDRWAVAHLANEGVQAEVAFRKLF